LSFNEKADLQKIALHIAPLSHALFHELY